MTTITRTLASPAVCGVRSGNAGSPTGVLACLSAPGHGGVHSWVGLTHDEGHRYYLNGAGPIVSVTTALGVLAKPALVPWAQRETATAAVKHHAFLGEHLFAHKRREPACAICSSATKWDGAEAAAVGWLKRMPGYQRDAAADMGTLVHRLAEQAAAGAFTEEIPEDALPFVAAYQRFQAEMKPTYLRVEAGIWNHRHDYAGTLDLICHIDGYTYLLDIKTGKGVYDDMALQLAAYGTIENVLAVPGRDTQVEMPDIQRFGILHIRPEGYRLVEFDVRPSTYRAFLAALELYRWQQEKAPKVIKEVAA